MKVLLVGCGYWGSKLLERLEKHIPVRDIIIAESNPSVVLPHNRLCIRSYQQALDSTPEIDACIVATPISTHYTIVKACLEAGKHVLVEKPLAKTGEQARELVTLAAARDKVLRTDLTFLEHPLVKPLAGADLVRLEWVGPASVRSDQSILWTWGPHPISIMLLAFGGVKPVEVSGHFSGAFCNLIYKFPDNKRVGVLLDYQRIPPHRWIIRNGDKAEIDLTPIPHPEPLAQVLGRFINAVIVHDTTPDWIGLKTVEVLEWTEQELAKQRPSG